MKITCCDEIDIDEDIMDLSEALSKAEDFSFHQPEYIDMAATKKAPATPKAATPKAAKTPAVKKESASKGVFGPRAIPDGFVGLSALATEFNLSPAVARRKLRALGGKPDGQHGWYWKEGSKELAAVRKALGTTKAE